MPEKAPTSEQILVEPISGVADLKIFDPALAGDLNSIQAIGMVYTGLVSLNDKLVVQKQLAQSYQMSPDGLTWTFTLLPNLKFSDGTALTSSDVAYSIDRALDPLVGSGVASTYLGLIKDADKRSAGTVKSLLNDSIFTPSSQTVIIRTSRKAAYFLQALTYNTSYVVEKKLIDKYGKNFTDHLNEGGCTGPWKVSSYTHGKEIVLVPNPYYYGVKPQLAKVVLSFYKSDATAYQAYQNGQLDSANVSSSLISTAKAFPDHQYHRVPILATDFIGMNYLTRPFDNLKIRQAFALALNKTVLAHNVEKDSRIATNHIVPQGMPAYDEKLVGPLGVKSVNGDQALAKTMFTEGMKEAGYTAQTFPKVTFSVATEGLTDASNLFSAIQQMWKTTLGVNVVIQNSDFDTLLNQISGSANNPKGLQMWYSDWFADYPDAQDWLTLQFGPQSSINSQNYGQSTKSYAEEQKTNQALMVNADTNQNTVLRMQQYNNAEQALVNDVAWLPIFQEASIYVQKPCVIGTVDNAQSLTPPDDWGAIYIAANTTCANAAQS